MVIAATSGRRPPRSAAWRAGFWPKPAETTFPSITSSTCSGARPARSTAAFTTIAPSCVALIVFKAPWNFPIGVRTALMMTGSFMVGLLAQAVTSLTAVCHPWHAPNHPWGAKTLHLVFIELLALPLSQRLLAAPNYNCGPYGGDGGKLHTS